MSAARSAPARRTQPTTGGWIALIVFFFLAGLGAIAALGTVGVYNALASNLPDPKTLESYALPEETVVYDRTGKVELARFGDFKREVVQFDEIPKVLIDATTAVEDKTFWENAGFDPVAILSAGIGSLRGDSRGASTITQQLVRARLLPEDLVADPHRTAERKLKEIVQSIRLTQAFEGLIDLLQGQFLILQQPQGELLLEVVGPQVGNVQGRVGQTAAGLAAARTQGLIGQVRHVSRQPTTQLEQNVAITLQFGLGHHVLGMRCLVRLALSSFHDSSTGNTRQG